MKKIVLLILISIITVTTWAGLDEDLFKAVNKNAHAKIKKLINKGANVNTKGENGITPLTVAAWNGDVKSIKLLVAKGANVNAQDSDGRPALHYATLKGDKAIEVAKYLIMKGAEINLKSNDGRTALDVAWMMSKTKVPWGKHIKMVDFLKSKGGKRVIAASGHTGKPKVLAPDFTVTEINSGKKVSLKDYRGKVVFLNFWATWCGFCRQEMPSMQSLYQKMKGKKFVILAVSDEKSSTVKKFLKTHKYTFPILLGDASNKYNLPGYPTTVIIDQKGYIIEKVSGAEDWSTNRRINFFNQLIENKK